MKRVHLTDLELQLVVRALLDLSEEQMAHTFYELNEQQRGDLRYNLYKKLDPDCTVNRKILMRNVEGIGKRP